MFDEVAELERNYSHFFGRSVYEGDLSQSIMFTDINEPCKTKTGYE